MSNRYDAIVIGTGQAGPALAGRLNREGLRTAIVERKLVGGTCVNVGCIPTKTLVGSARAAYMARQAGEFGVVVDGPVRVDMQRVKGLMKGNVFVDLRNVYEPERLREAGFDYSCIGRP